MNINIGGIFVYHKFHKYFGFTLVETLVVILIISVLAGMVMIVSVSAFDNAAATKIVNDFKIIQKASVMCKSEKNGWWPGGTSNEQEKVSVLAAKYTDSPNINAEKVYRIWGGPHTPGWGIFFVVDLTKMKRTDQLKNIFKAKANGGLGVQLYHRNYSTEDLNKNKWSPYEGRDEVYFCISESYY